MNSIILLEKLYSPTNLGLENEITLLNQQTIMDAYLSAASVETNRQILGIDSMPGYVNKCANDLFQDLDKLVLPENFEKFDLFKKFTPEIDAQISIKKPCESNFQIHFNKEISVSMEKNTQQKTVTSVAPETTIHEETELDSYTKIEPKQIQIKETGKERIDKNNIGKFMKNERRRLLCKIKNCRDERIVFRKRTKHSKKNPNVSLENYRGSKYWGVSKNKSKWQVSFPSSVRSLDVFL